MQDRIIKFLLLGIWLILIIFGVISLLKPAWLQDVYSSGKHSAAMEQKNYGDFFLRNRKYRIAVSHYKKALKIEPDLYNAYGNLGICYSKLEQFDKAVRIFQYLLNKDQKQISTNYYNLAEIYQAKDDLNTAAEYYKLAAETSHYPVYSYQYLGKICLELQDWEAARKAFNSALENRLTLENSYRGMLKKNEAFFLDDPQISKKIIELRKSPIPKDKYDSEVFSEMLSQDRELAKTHNLLGYVYVMLNDLVSAKNNFQRAIEIWPHYSEAKKNLKKLNSEFRIKSTEKNK